MVAGALLAALLVVSSMAASAATGCEDTSPQPGLERFYAESWGIDPRNTRYQPRSTLTSRNAATL